MALYGRDRYPPGFQWDPAKYDANLEKWKIRFEHAAKVFADPLCDEQIDLRMDYNELRFVAVGEVDGDLLYVAFTLRGEDDEVTHIISARRLLPAERRAYAKVRSGSD
ncbi:BrnT family toxin [Beijerinckia sp. L45]|uniref:BrnT family toxin n=1 Tax=Beijerinckia sp. L45 TaxID=1641855 RepID=UPI00131D45E4|nr:BrnT family toxin [Beijerinckia sp. L45]